MKFQGAYLFLCVFFVQCSTTQNIDLNPPVDIVEVYAQSWVAGVRGGGSGTNVFLTVSEEMALDSIYFLGKRAKLSLIDSQSNRYVARFSSNENSSKDLIMHSDPKKEYGNTLDNLPRQFPFQLAPNEAVVSYQKRNKTRYFTIKEIAFRKEKLYPSAPPSSLR
jgi:hypothetical protein